jgi:uncharacterized protein (TIGR02646 family)
MILIKKGKEPYAWQKYRTTPGVQYQAIPALVQALLQEQGYLCAYCMRRIPVCDPGSTERHRVEHLEPRTLHPDRALDYRNMVACCPGHIGSEDHCDRSKRDQEITCSPLDAHFIDTIAYSSDGTIRSTDAVWTQEMNDILHLNTPLLKENRHSVVVALTLKIRYEMDRKHKTKLQILKSLLEKYDYTDKSGAPFEPYCGVAIYFLRKMIRQEEAKRAGF